MNPDGTLATRRGWWARWRRRAQCFHHNSRTGSSWVAGRIIGAGSRKLWRCTACDKTWIK